MKKRHGSEGQQQNPSKRRREHVAAAGTVGALTGAAIGVVGGPAGVVTGAIIGGLAGAVGIGVSETNAADLASLEHDLDAETPAIDPAARPRGAHVA